MRLRAALAAVALCTALLPWAIGPAPGACAAEAPHAALVVSTGTTVHRYCVALDGSSVSGIHLIELAHDQYGLSFRSDGGALCMLAGVGPAQGDCFSGYPSFWGYWRGDGSGGWKWSALGAASTVVHSGAVEGWAWGSGDDGATHPPPPETTFTSVCGAPTPAVTPAASASPTLRPQQSPSPKPSAAASTPAPSPRGSPGNHRPHHPGRSPHGHRRNTPGVARTGPHPSGWQRPSPRSSRALTAERTSATGPPPAGIAALVVAAALVFGGWLIVRRRHLRA
ncbi:MAG: hypothetical protein M3P18_26730 [Actinomycetota bacterium]|nr:hypothetical protein [Actinomycetota bacterium]